MECALLARSCTTFLQPPTTSHFSLLSHYIADQPFPYDDDYRTSARVEWASMCSVGVFALVVQLVHCKIGHNPLVWQHTPIDTDVAHSRLTSFDNPCPMKGIEVPVWIVINTPLEHHQRTSYLPQSRRVSCSEARDSKICVFDPSGGRYFQIHQRHSLNNNLLETQER